MNAERAQPESRWPHRLAVALCCATFPLIWVGGLVTTYDAGMAVPDWPTTYGYNLFLYPWSTWFFGPWDLFIEHGHRLLGALVGLLAIALVAGTLFWDRRRWIRVCALVALALVVVQGILGGARVLLDERLLAMLHACLGPAFFAFCVALAGFTSRLWRGGALVESHAAAPRLHRLAVLCTVFACLQLVLGAQLRHIPVMATPRAFQIVVLFHLGNALIVVGYAAALAWHVWRVHAGRVPLLMPCLWLLGLILGQLLLGAASWVVKYGWPDGLAQLPLAAGYTVQAASMTQAVIVTGHMAVGSLILATSVMVLVRALRLVRGEAAAIGLGAVSMGMSS